MTTGHMNPGYGDIMSRMRRIKSAGPGLALSDAQFSLDTFTLDQIRQQAREMWADHRGPTSYHEHYQDRCNGRVVSSGPRPTSPNRNNKPHPPMVFLTTRLHNCPGYHNPDATLGKPTYRVDGSLPREEQLSRSRLRSKYIGRPNTTAVMQFQRHEELDAIEDPIERQGTEAVLKILPDEERDEWLDQLRTETEVKRAAGIYSPAPPQEASRTPVPSLYRHLKTAGAEEFFRLADVNHRQRGKLLHPRERLDIISRRLQDIESTRPCRYTHQSKRGDFLMHPEWMPTMPHHRLNGLSSVDVPYFPGRR